MYLGYLNDFPEHWTQGIDFEDLKEHLQDLYEEFSSARLNARVLFQTPGTVSARDRRAWCVN